MRTIGNIIYWLVKFSLKALEILIYIGLIYLVYVGGRIYIDIN